MSNMQHRGWIFFSGALWLLIGMMLLGKGLKYTSDANWIIAGFAIGFVKSFVLRKTVRRVTSRIQSLPLPIRFKDVYSPSYFALIGLMISLGFILRFFPDNIHGLIDIAVGAALIRGASDYFTYGIGFPARSQ